MPGEANAENAAAHCSQSRPLSEGKMNQIARALPGTMYMVQATWCSVVTNDYSPIHDACLVGLWLKYLARL